jgi:hypothetical protein
MKYLKDYKLFENIDYEDVENSMIDYIDNGEIKVEELSYDELEKFYDFIHLYEDNIECDKFKYLRSRAKNVINDDSILLKISINHRKDRMRSQNIDIDGYAADYTQYLLRNFIIRYAKLNNKSCDIYIRTVKSDYYNDPMSVNQVIINIK